MFSSFGFHISCQWTVQGGLLRGNGMWGGSRQIHGLPFQEREFEAVGPAFAVASAAAELAFQQPCFDSAIA